MQQGGLGMNPTPTYNQPQYSQYSGGVRPGSMPSEYGGTIHPFSETDLQVVVELSP